MVGWQNYTLHVQNAQNIVLRGEVEGQMVPASWGLNTKGSDEEII